MIEAPYTYSDIHRWLSHYEIQTQHLTDVEVRQVYEREARARVNKLRNEQVKEIFAVAARKQPQNIFLVSLASAVVSATDDEFFLLRPAALVFIERFQL